MPRRRVVSLYVLSGLVSLLAMLLITVVPTEAVPYSDSQYFPETGYTVKGAFKAYWERQGGLLQFGFPLTNEFKQFSPTDPDKWYLTQYFQRAIFEYHPEKAGTQYEVLLRLVGNLATTGKGRTFPKASPSVALGNVGYFWQTGHSLAEPFLSYWNSTGGVRAYGYPISEELIEVNPADGKAYTVQYFERARFEYHPENAGTPYEVLLGFLGWQELQDCDLPPNDNYIGQPYRTLGPPVKLPDPTPTPTSAPIITPTTPSLTPGSTPQPTATPVPMETPLTITPLKIPFSDGINVWAYGAGTNSKRLLDMVVNAGLTYVRQQLRWDYIETSPGHYYWDDLDKLVTAVSAHNLKLVLSVAKAPTWYGTGPEKLGLPTNPQDFYNFMDLVSARYKGQVTAYEIWNEENTARESGEVSVPRYVQTLEAGYTAIKKNDPDAIVISGGTTATGVDRPGDVMDDLEFIEDCYQYNNGEWRNYFDVLGVHPGGAANPPDELWPNDPPQDKSKPWTTHPSFYFRRFENEREAMVKYGDGDKQIWLTEFGWATVNVTPGFEFGALNNEQQQADYTVQAFEMGKNYQYLGAMLLWNLNFFHLTIAQRRRSGRRL